MQAGKAEADASIRVLQSEFEQRDAELHALREDRERGDAELQTLLKELACREIDAERSRIGAEALEQCVAEEKAQAEATLKDLQAVKAETKAELRMLRGELATKEEDVERAEKEIEASGQRETKEKANAEAHLQVLRSEKTEGEAELQTLRGQLAGHEADAERAQKVVEAPGQCEAELQRVQAARAEAETELQALHAAKTKSEAELLELREDKVKGDVELQALRGDRVNGEAELHTLRRELASRQTEVERSIENFEALQQRETETNAKAESEFQVLRDKLAVTEADLERCKNDVEALEQREADLDRREAELDAREEDETVQDRIPECRTGLHGADTRGEALPEDAKKAQCDAEELRGQVFAQQKELRQVRERLARCEAPSTVATAGRAFVWDRQLREEAPEVMSRRRDRRVDTRVAIVAKRAPQSGAACRMCYDREACCALLPCRHSALCTPCGKRAWRGSDPTCPYCRAPVTGVVEFHGEPKQKAKPRILFVLGGPGAGKGTQCDLVLKNHSLWGHISAGDCLRAERKNNESQDGKLINSIISEGKIVPSRITVKLIKKAMDALALEGKSCFLVDGYPRNIDNDEARTEVVGDSADVRGVLFYEVPEETLESRLLKRGETSGRSDDTPEVIRRFRTYQEETRPIIERYKEAGKVFEINGSRTVEEVWEETQRVVKAVSA